MSFAKENSRQEQSLSIGNRIMHGINYCTSRVVEAMSFDIPLGLQIPITAMYLMSLGALLVLFFIQGYNEQKDSTYLSFLTSSEPSRNCELIPLSNTGTYVASHEGYWQGSNNYLFERGTFVLVTQDFKVTYSEYKEQLDYVYQFLVKRGELMKTRDLTYNFLNWMSLVHVNNSKGSLRFHLAGTPRKALGREFTRTNMGSAAGVCKLRPDTRMDSNTGYLQISYDREQYLNDEFCSNIFNPDEQVTLNNYALLHPPPSYFFEFDTRALVTATAVNFDIINVNQLSVLNTYDTKRIPSAITPYIDPRYEQMDPIYCINVTGIRKCTIAVSGTPLMGVLLHAGHRKNGVMQPCVCSELTRAELDNPYHECNLLHFKLITLIWPDNALYGILEYLSSLAVNPNRVYDLFNLSYFVSEDAEEFGFINTTENRKRAFSVCTTAAGGECSAIVTSVFNINYHFWTVGTNFYQVDHGACADSISTSYESWLVRSSNEIEIFINSDNSYTGATFLRILMFN